MIWQTFAQPLLWMVRPRGEQSPAQRGSLVLAVILGILSPQRCRRAGVPGAGALALPVGRATVGALVGPFSLRSGDEI